MASSEQLIVEPVDDEEEEEEAVDDINNGKKVHVAVGKKFKQEKKNLLWVMKSFPGATIIIIHVHWPSKLILTDLEEMKIFGQDRIMTQWKRSNSHLQKSPTQLLLRILKGRKWWIVELTIFSTIRSINQELRLIGAKFLYESANEQSQAWHRDEERRKMKSLIDDYKNVCVEREVKAYHTERKDVLEGIQYLVDKYQIKRLVMGSRSMSKQASLLRSCQIWLVCKGQHVSTSKAISEQTKKHAWPEGSSKTQVLAPHADSDAFATRSNEPEEGIETDQDDGVAVADHDECETMGQEAPFHLVRQQSAEREDNKSVSLKESVVKLEMQLKEAKRKLEKEKRGLERILSLPILGSRRKRRQDDHNLITPSHIRQFTKAELKKVTNNFSSRKRIGEGGYGPVYKAELLGNKVAIKMLSPESSQGHKEYQQELKVLSTVEHPNIVKLIGFCSELSALVYEYLPHHSLNQRLAGGMQWQDRIRIIREQRSALIYLHTSTDRGQTIIHADLKFSNILLDENDVSRLGDFGTARMIAQSSSKRTTIFWNTNPMGTTGYMDPAFLVSGKLTPQSDIYSFGIIILRLLTGLPELNIAERVEEAIRRGVVCYILDASAGDWPVANTKQLLQLALRCCDLDRRKRPSLESQEWRTLEILQAMAGNCISNPIEL